MSLFHLHLEHSSEDGALIGGRLPARHDTSRRMKHSGGTSAGSAYPSVEDKQVLFHINAPFRLIKIIFSELRMVLKLHYVCMYVCTFVSTS